MSAAVTGPPTTSTRWRGPDPRTVALQGAWLVPPVTSVLLSGLATGGHLGARAAITLAAIGVTFVVRMLVGLVRWSRTRYRVTPDAFQVRSGIFVLRSRAVPLDRIRSVDLTANPLHRLLGLAVVRVGTAASTDGRTELRVDALSRAAATELRDSLLAGAGTVADEPTVSTLDPRWVRYAPLTFWALGGVFVAVASAYRILDAVGVEPWRVGVVRRAFEEFGSSALWLTVPLLVLAVVLVGGAGAAVLYAENWWHYRLDQLDGGMLRVRRGLLTTRSVSIERRQLRGVVLREPLLLRAGGGARVNAVAGGLGDEDENRRRSAVLPPAPRAEALRVVDRLAGGAVFDQALTRHPRVALRRRVLRGLALVVLPVTVALTVLGVLLTGVLLYCAAAFLVLAAPATCWLARDAYRNLGHGVDDRHLLLRSGTFSRDSVALRRDAVLAWTFSSSPFGRRAGVVTATAAVAAGEQGYRIPDIAVDRAVPFADAAAPGILTEFLTHA
ncbi:MAG: PH domain-containing protein [Actinocatenispora sp.]